MEFAGVSFKLLYRFDPGGENDGVAIAVPENSLNLLPAHLPDYPIPGYAADFAEAMLRSLPKDIRRQLGGIPQCAVLFAEEFKRDLSLREIPPAEVMADFLKNILDIEVNRFEKWIVKKSGMKRLENFEKNLKEGDMLKALEALL